MFYGDDLTFADGVALRKESVDRNRITRGGSGVGSWSLSARRAWIEMFSVREVFANFEVALRKESVDRNRKSGCAE